MDCVLFVVLYLVGVVSDGTNAFVQQAPLSLRVAGVNGADVPRFGLFEATLDLSATYDNAFDPDDIDVWAVFTQQEGKPIRVNGFLDQTFTSKLVDGQEVVEAAGAPVWRVRFRPDALGEWQYRIFAKDRTGSVSTEPATIRAVESSKAGPVKAPDPGSRYFVLNDGKPFFAVGENMCWSGKRGTFDYEDWLGALSRAGGNWVRLWTSSWNCALEWTADAKTPRQTDAFHGVGLYNLANAWRLDRILDLAEGGGVYVMFCLGTYGEFTTGGFFGEGQWKSNPYNAANGGPCAQPEDFWTNGQARKLYQRRLRYFGARYGWRSNLFAWEFWNETKAPPAWVAEMARCLRGTGDLNAPRADAFNHPVSTTYGDKEVWQIPEIDFTMSHHYGQGNIADSAPIINADARSHDVYAKPHLMAEFGIDWRKSDNPYDPQFKGVNLHNGLWASACSGNAGGAMIWYWDGYVHPGNLYAQFGALHRFADNVPWAKGRWTALDIDAPRVPGEATSFRDLMVAPSVGWGRCPVDEFAVEPDPMPNLASIPSFLYAPAKADLRTTPTFHVKFERPGKFVLHVDTVSDRARLRFLLDGQLAHEVALSANPPKDASAKPEYEKADFRAEYGVYQAIFNKDYEIEVPAGAHDIRLEVTEGDWLSVSRYTLTNYTSSRYVNVQCYGMTNGETAVLWIHNGDHHWRNVLEGKTIAAIEGAETTLRGLRPGEYTCEWWDTWQGKTDQSIPCASSETGLRLSLPAVAADVAARIAPR
jgi:hypothetical protein